MDRLLKLKLEILYKDLPIEQAQEQFNAIKQIPPPTEDTKPKKRKLRIPPAQSK
jgi:hypothetical protein